MSKTLARDDGDWQCARLSRAGALIAICLCAPASWLGCSDEPLVLLGSLPDAETESDTDSVLDEQERERLFRELAAVECNEDEPVCGADGKTYMNYCRTLASGTQVIAEGPCP